MPRSLSTIPAGTPITDRNGIITIFFRLAWQILVDGFQQAPTVALIDATGQAAAIATTNAVVTTAAGTYRVSYALAKTIVDGAASSTTVTIGWTENGVAKTHSFAAFTTDTTTAVDSGTWTLHADGNTPITYAVAYSSTTPGKMHFDLHLPVEWVV